MNCAVMTYNEQVCQQLRARTEPLKAVGHKHDQCTWMPEGGSRKQVSGHNLHVNILGSFHIIYRSYTPPFAQCFHLQHINRHAHSTNNKQLWTTLQKAGSLVIRLSMWTDLFILCYILNLIRCRGFKLSFNITLKWKSKAQMYRPVALTPISLWCLFTSSACITGGRG